MGPPARLDTGKYAWEGALLQGGDQCTGALAQLVRGSSLAHACSSPGPLAAKGVATLPRRMVRLSVMKSFIQLQKGETPRQAHNDLGGLKDDELGRELKSVLLERARAGVRVYFLYDEIGSHDLPESYKEELRTAGGEST